MALFKRQQYGAAAEDAIYNVDGIYTFAESGERLNFREGNLSSVFGITGLDETAAPDHAAAWRHLHLARPMDGTES